MSRGRKFSFKPKKRKTHIETSTTDASCAYYSSQEEKEEQLQHWQSLLDSRGRRYSNLSISNLKKMLPVDPAEMKGARLRKRRYAELNILAHEYRNQLMVAAESIRCRLGTANVALVLGSGLGGFEEKLLNAQELAYSDIPFLPQPTVAGHSGRIIVGDLIDKKEDDADGGETKRRQRVMCFSGRLHAYEGYPMYQVVFCARLSYLCGCHTIILTNAAGGCIPGQTAGSVVVCDDYIRDVAFRMLNHSANDAMFGVRHPRGDQQIDKELTEVFWKAAKDTGFPAYRGNYWLVSGPTYETAAHIRYVIRSGGHAVGMSTVPSVQAGANMGLRCVVLSLATNVAAGLSDEEMDHKAVVAEAKKAAVGFGNMVEEGILRIPKPSAGEGSSSRRDADKHKRFYPVKSAQLLWDYTVAPRIELLSYDKLYADIKYVKSFLHSVLDLAIEIGIDGRFGREASESEDLSRRMELISPETAPVLVPKGSLPAPLDATTAISARTAPMRARKSPRSKTPSFSNLFMRRVSNPSGPVPVWLLHDPFWFDIGKSLDCPITIPLYELRGFRSIAFSNSSRKVCVTYGIDPKSNLVAIVSNLHLDSLVFDEMNMIVSLIHGTVGHQNLFFMNVFTGFNPRYMYTGSDGVDKTESHEGSFTVAQDYVDFHGGMPRYPFPLLPNVILDADDPTEDDSSSIEVASGGGMSPHTHSGGDVHSGCGCQLRMKHGFVDVKRNRAHRTVVDILNHHNDVKLESLSYGYWPGPSLPSVAECTLTTQANCDLIGITNPKLPHMARQLGMDGYNVIHVATEEDLNYITSAKSMSEERLPSKDVTDMVLEVSDKLVAIFGKAAFRFSPAVMSVSSPTRFLATAVTDTKLAILKGCKRTQDAPCYQVLPHVAERWADIKVSGKWLYSKWNFRKKPIKHVVMSHFSNPFGLNAGKELMTIDLREMPYWCKYFCGGTPYTHLHLTDTNPFEWELRIYETQVKKELYAVIAPAVFEKLTKFVREASTGKLPGLPSLSEASTFVFPGKGGVAGVDMTEAKHAAGMRNIHKYLPCLWNLEFLVRVLWKCGVANACFISQLFGTDNSKFGLPTHNGVVIVDNYVEATKWNTLTGPNDERMGPRFVPMTEPVELTTAFQDAVERVVGARVPEVVSVHVPTHALISPLSKAYYASVDLEVMVNGLIPCIQTASHVGMKKMALGLVDFKLRRGTIQPKLEQGFGSFNKLMQCVEQVFETATAHAKAAKVAEAAAATATAKAAATE